MTHRNGDDGRDGEATGERLDVTGRGVLDD